MSSSPPSKILIIGGTGTIGRYITKAILSASPPVAQQVSLFTSPATASSPAKQELLTTWKQQGLMVITGDVRRADDVLAAYNGVDTVVSCLGRNGLALQMELLRLAEESETVRWFFPSEYGTDIEYDASSKDEKPHQNKLKVRKYISDTITKVKCTYVVTGPYIDMFLHFPPGAERVGGYDPRAKKAVVVGSGSDRIGFTTMPDVGKAVVAALRHPEVSKGKALRVQSFVTTPNDILDEFIRQTGPDWEVEHTSNQQLRDLEIDLWDNGSPSATVATLRRIWAEGGTLYDKTDNELLGLEDMESLSAVVARAVNCEGY
ncbi:NAD(P)-binding protein [Xylariomycetidae sp. FL0641]|nr:NAD(P)-binding protein [Xylariomycetidae sp. FL0641]